MTDIITLTMNPAIDVSTSVARIEPTRKLRCKALQRDAGGGGINVARVVRRFGVEVTAIYPTGEAIGRLLRRLVDERGIKSVTIDIAGETREDFTAADEAAGVQYRFVLPGPELSEPEWRACLDALARIAPRPRFVVASGSLPPGAPEDFYARAADVAHTLGARFVLDTSGAALKAAVARGVDLLKPNLRELQELMQDSLETTEARVAACRKLIATRSIEVMALTLAEDGALLVTGDGAWRAKAPPVELVSAVGAGDSFLAAMVFAMAQGRPMPEALRLAVAAGSATLLTPGTGLCNMADVERILPDVQVERIEEA